MNNSPDMFRDMMASAWFCHNVRASNSYAQNLYAAICNNDFQKLETWTLLKDETWSASWRMAGGIVADIREEGDYLNWYCSGIIDNESPKGYVPEGVVTEEIAEDLKRLEWQVINDGQPPLP
jgi:hypothetical protein